MKKKKELNQFTSKSIDKEHTKSIKGGKNNIIEYDIIQDNVLL